MKRGTAVTKSSDENLTEINSRITRAASHPVDLAAGLEHVLEELAQRGIQISPASRVPTYVRTLRRLRSTRSKILEHRADVVDFLTALVEGNYVLDAYVGLSHPPEVPGWPDKLKLALEGRPELTAEDKSRDLMMELVTSASAHRGGLGVQFGEPDVCIVEGGQTYGVAAKRVHSLKKLGERIRRGANQVRDEKLNGFVAVDLTVALEFHHWQAEPGSLKGLVIPRAEDAEESLAEVRMRIYEALPDDALAHWLRDRPMIGGVAGFAYAPRIIQDGAQPVILKCWVHRPVPTATPEALKFFLKLPAHLRFV